MRTIVMACTDGRPENCKLYEAHSYLPLNDVRRMIFCSFSALDRDKLTAILEFNNTTTCEQVYVVTPPDGR